jgi:hypothetical protein
MPGSVGYREDGTIFISYRDNSGTPVSGRFDSVNQLIHISANNGTITRTGTADLTYRVSDRKLDVRKSVRLFAFGLAGGERLRCGILDLEIGRN